MPPSGDLLSSVVKEQQGFIRAFYVPPSLIDQWAHLPGTTEQASQLDFILYGGGPLPSAVGQKLSEVTHVCQMYGSAEVGQIQLLVPQKGHGDWAYMEWNPSEEVDMQPSIDGTYELVLHQDPKFRKHRSLSHNFPEVDIWRSGDLFVPHPVKLGLWQYHGRIDDLIVLANSHKIHPVAFENAIQSHPTVSGVLMFGTGKLQPGLLVELLPATTNFDQLKADIWETVDSMNTQVPRYGRISQSKILFALSEKPFMGDKAMTRPEIDSSFNILVVAGTFFSLHYLDLITDKIIGSETNATLLSGLLYTLGLHPDITRKLVVELDANFNSPQDLDMTKLANLTYLNAVLEEGLRIYPPSAFNQARVVPAQGGTICGKFVPPGTSVGVATWAASRAVSNWTRPEEFIPERWIGEGLPGDDRKSMQPFLLGPRGCLGKK